MVEVFISPNDVVVPKHLVNNKDITENDGVLLLEKNKHVLKKIVNIYGIKINVEVETCANGNNQVGEKRNVNNDKDDEGASSSRYPIRLPNVSSKCQFQGKSILWQGSNVHSNQIVNN